MVLVVTAQRRAGIRVDPRYGGSELRSARPGRAADGIDPQREGRARQARKRGSWPTFSLTWSAGWGHPPRQPEQGGDRRLRAERNSHGDALRRRPQFHGCERARVGRRPFRFAYHRASRHRLAAHEVGVEDHERRPAPVRERGARRRARREACGCQDDSAGPRTARRRYGAASAPARTAEERVPAAVRRGRHSHRRPSPTPPLPVSPVRAHRLSRSTVSAAARE